MMAHHSALPGIHEHILVDQEGMAELRRKTSRPDSEILGDAALSGMPVYVDTCPCAPEPFPERLSKPLFHFAGF